MFKRILIAASIAVVTGLPTMGGAAFAQNQPIVGISTVTTYSIAATITAIDPAKRTITFTGPAGRSLTHTVAGTVRMDDRKVGDRVSLAVEDRLSFVLSAPDGTTPRDRELNVTATATTGPRAAVAMADQAVVNWWVTAVNPSAGTISMVNPAGGEVRTFAVETDAGRAQLPRVKPGDRLTAINTQVAVVAITPAN